MRVVFFIVRYKMFYSVFYFLGRDEPIKEEILVEILHHYQSGTKIYAVFARKEQLIAVVEAIDSLLEKKLLSRYGSKLVPYCGKEEISLRNNYFHLFHGKFYLLDLPYPVDEFMIINGEIGDKLTYLEAIKEKSKFDLSQFLGEHGKNDENILIDGHGGTGKTHTLLAHFLYLWFTTDLDNKEFLESNIIVVFEEAIAEYYRKIIINDLENTYKLSQNNNFAVMLGMKNDINISTVYQLALFELKKKNFNYEIIDDYSLLKEIILEKTRFLGEENLKKMELFYLTFEEINTHLFEIVKSLYQENVVVEQLTAEIFGNVDSQDDFFFLKTFYHRTALEVGVLWKNTLISQEKIHKIQMISHFLQSEPKGKVGKRKTVLLDDFNLGKESDLKALFTWYQNEKATLFICQNTVLSQSEKRKKDIFRLISEHTVEKNLWQFISLKNQYRKDMRSSQIFQNLFSKLGVNIDFERNFSEGYNDYLSRYPEKIYSEVKYSTKSHRNILIYEEVLRFYRRLAYERKNNIVHHSRINSFAVVLANEIEAKEISEFLMNFGFTVNKKRKQPPFLHDLKILLHFILFQDEVTAWNFLAQSNFFHLDIPKSMLYWKKSGGLWKDKGNELFQFLQGELNGIFCKSQSIYPSLAEVSELIYLDIQILVEFYEITKPWEKYHCSRSFQEEYRSCLKKIWLMVEEKEIHSFIELYEFIENLEDYDFNTDGNVQNDSEIDICCIPINHLSGLEFGHILVDLSGESMVSEQAKFVQRNLFSYHFETKIRKNVIENQFYNIEQRDIAAEKFRYLYYVLSKYQYSFSWLSLESNKEDKLEKFLKKGLDFL